MIKNKKNGRPLKYKALIQCLEPNDCYDAGAIVANGISKRLFDSIRNDECITLALAKRRVRKALNAFKKSHGFPKQGDGHCLDSAGKSAKGWYGWRWKRAAGIEYKP